jgi:glycosyltransferase involved in cell wall biosynthesis
MDVVVVTLMRDSLPYALQSARSCIPNPNFIFITEKGIVGELRNKGLRQCTSEYVCFMDDDVLLNKDWYEKCMRYLMQHPEAVTVGGRFKTGYTCGCIICRAKEFIKLGGFPRLETTLGQKLGKRAATVEDAICEHIAPPLTFISRQFYWLTEGYQTESKIGFNVSPRQSLTLMAQYLWAKEPEYALIQPLWIIKAMFALPFRFSMQS